MTPNNGLVSICPGSCSPWRTIKAFAASEGIDEDSLTFFAPPSCNASLLSPGSASAALCCASSLGQSHNREALALIAKLLKPGSKVYVHDAALVRSTPEANHEATCPTPEAVEASRSSSREASMNPNIPSCRAFEVCVTPLHNAF